MAARGPRVTLKHVGLGLGGTTILDDVSFTVEPNSLHCLIGPNGGGKTSIIRCLLGQMPHAGTIAIDWPGERVIGYMPQRFEFDPTLPITVEDFLAVTQQRRPAFFGIAKRCRPAIDDALAQVGMAGKRKRTMGQLSGGERQRVLLAQALMPEPALLLLDEPATNLDEEGAAVLQQVIATQRENGATVLWIHHDFQQVREKADAVTCVNRQVQFTGAPGEVLDPEHIMEAFAAH